MASWSSGRPSNARRITLSLSDELKNTLVRTKALTGKSFNFQIIEALRGLTAPTPPAYVSIAQVRGLPILADECQKYPGGGSLTHHGDDFIWSSEVFTIFPV